MKNIIVFYHDDHDGFGAAWSAWKKFKNKAEYIAINHGDSIPDLKNKEIYFVDFCPSKSTLVKFLLVNKKVVVIDHHVSVKDVVESVPDYVYSEKNSGAVLAWRYFHPEEKVPVLLKYVEEMDIWKFKMSDTSEVISSLALRDFDFKVWDKMAKDLEDKNKKKGIIKEGKTVLKYKEKLIKQLLKKISKVKIDGEKAFAVNSPSIFASETGNYIVNKKKAIGIIWNYSDGNIKVSLRSKKGMPDVSKIAEKFGGGGHRNASGFAVSSKEKFPWK